MAKRIFAVIRVAGVRHHYKGPAEHVRVGRPAILEPEPTNEYDPFAVKVLAEIEDSEEPQMIGYIPRTHSQTVSAAYNDPRLALSASVTSTSPTGSGRGGKEPTLIVTLYTGKDD